MDEDDPQIEEDNLPPPKPFRWWHPLVGANPKVTIIRAAVIGVVCYLVFSYVFLPMRVVGISMEPTYRDGGVNFINGLSYTFNEPQRGDIVAIKHTGRRVLLLKRIIALPGESFFMREGEIFIEGERLEEPYTTINPDWKTKGENTLGDEEYLVIGDNRDMRQAEHVHGAVDRRRIVGKIMF